MKKVCVNVISAASAAHVRHHVALPDVGAGFLDSAYFRAQRARENLIEASLVPHTILRSTQVFEDIDRTDRYSLAGSTVRVAPACVQPVLSEEVAAASVDLAVSFPRNSTLKMAGPERLRLDELVRRFLSVTEQACEVVTDAQACYFGAKVRSTDLMAADEETIIGVTRFEEWLSPQRGASALGPSYARSSTGWVQP